MSTLVGITEFICEVFIVVYPCTGLSYACVFRVLFKFSTLSACIASVTSTAYGLLYMHKESSLERAKFYDCICRSRWDDSLGDKRKWELVTNFCIYIWIDQAFLDAFVEAADSSYGCLLVHGKVAVATRKWWTFTSTELVLLSMIVAASPKCSSRDIPVFLPHTSPTVSVTWLPGPLWQAYCACEV